MPAIQYLTRHQINSQRWDECIEAADNGLVYGYTFYLDNMSKQWAALVLGDYDAVMPLTYNKKYSIYYLYQPAFTASLGVFGKQITAALLQDFLKAIPKKFRYWDIYLNYGNYFSTTEFDLYQRMNFVLPLQDQYEKLHDRYRDNIKRNIKKCEQQQAIIKTNISVDEVIALSKTQSKAFSSTTEEDYQNIKKVYLLLQQKNQAITYGLYNAGGQLMASAAFLFSHGRAYYILVGNDPYGKTMGASHALINAFIKDHAGKNLLLDFEGSDVPGLAFFYSSFGAREELYAGLKLNRLPFLLRLIKN